jgi:Right handed beta helix region
MRSRGAAIALAALGALVIPGGHAEAAVTCGATVTKDVKLKKNLTDCSGDGLVVGASNITIDLNGHRITGQDAPGSDGITAFGGFLNLRIKGGGGGQVAHFDQAVTLQDAASSRVKGLKIKHSRIGVAVGGDSNFTRIMDNKISEIELYGIGTAIADDLEIAGNELTGPTDSGFINGAISVNGTQDTLVEKNILFGGDDGDYGILVHGNAQGAKVKKNDVRRHQISGIDLYNGAVGTSVNGNDVIANGFTGIIVESGAGTGTLVLNNTARRNDVNGIDIEKSGVEVGDNVANDNDQWGIFALPGVVDLGGNKAQGNGQPSQCSGITCN